MRNISKYIGFLAASLTALVGCSATSPGSYSKKAHREIGFSALPFTLTVEEDFSSLHSQVFSKFEANGGLVSNTILTSNNVNIDVIEVDMPNDFYWKPSVFGEDKLLTHVLTRSCEGTVVADIGRAGESKMDFGDAFASKAISILEYGASEQEAQVFHAQVRSGSLFGMSQRRSTRGFPQASSREVQYRLNTPSLFDELISSIEDARKSALSLGSHSQAHGLYLCVQDSKINSGLLLTEMFSYENSEAGRNAFYAVYYPTQFFDKLGQEQAASLIAWANRVDSSERRARSEMDRIKILVSDVNTSHKDVWDKRLTASYSIGDRVCTLSNLVGNVEQVSGDKVKVLWTRALDEQEGYFFGKLYFSDYDKSTEQFKYSFQDIQRLDWATKSDVAACTINVK